MPKTAWPVIAGLILVSCSLPTPQERPIKMTLAEMDKAAAPLLFWDPRKTATGRDDTVRRGWSHQGTLV